MAVTETRTPPLFEQFFAVRRFAAALSFTADGEQVLFANNLSGQFNLWRVPIQGGWPDQLTAFADETVRGVGVSRDGRIVLCADHDGDEFHQLYMLDPERGWPEQLTSEPQVQHFVGSDAWSPDGRKFAYAANARKPTDMECWVRDAASGETRPVFGELPRWYRQDNPPEHASDRDSLDYLFGRLSMRRPPAQDEDRRANRH